MIKVTYTELDGPSGPTLRLEAAGHAGYAPAGQDIVCAGASTLMQTLVYLLAGEESAKSDAWDEPEGPRLAVTAAAPRKPWVEGAFEFAKAGFALLAERYPDNVRFADLSGRGEQCMVDLQLFAEGEGGAAPPPASAPALSRAQQQQAIASGTMKAAEAEAPAQPPQEAVAEEAGETEQPEPAAEPTAPAAGLPPGRKRHPPRQRGGDQSGRGQHDPGPAGSAGAAGAARGADQVLTSHRCGLASPAPCGAPRSGEPRINVRGNFLF